MRHLEKNEMKQITIMMYFWSIMYYLILFILPYVFKKHYCGGLFYNGLYLCYGTYAITNAIWEVYIVLRIQNVIRKKYENKNKAKRLLDFNRWHIVELFMGQIARLDTFVCFLFIVILKDCPELKVWMYVCSFWMIANLIFPITSLIEILCNKTRY